MGMKTVLVGGKAEARLAGMVDLGSAVDMTGQFSLAEFIGLIDAAAVMITTDSGPFHIAAALKRPVVGLFRERASAHSRTYSDIAALIGRNAICEAECDAYECGSMPCREMQDLSVTSVFESVRKMAA
jgi:ADP-heptose:LPS heptosyltransferase